MTAFAVAWLVLRLAVLVGLPVAIVTRFAIGSYRFVTLDSAAKRNYPAALWARFRWRWLCRSLGLAWIDQHTRAVNPLPLSTSVHTGRRDRQRLRYPRASVRADRYGLTIRVKTIPKVGRAEVEAAADHIANATRSHRVSVTASRPGRLTVRCLRQDPLIEALPVADLPAFDGRHAYLGRDEMGELRRVSLANHAGSLWAGSPGRGKTECGLSLAVQLAASPLVDMWVLDGGELDWEGFAPGARGYVAGDLEAAADMLADLDAAMTRRRSTMQADLGVRNGWAIGPTPEYPLQWVLIEEFAVYLSLDHVKGDGKREKQVARCRGLAGNLLRRGRAPLFHTSLCGQRVTTTNLPSDIRDLAGVRWSFGCSTLDAAIAALGADVRDYPTLQPTLLQGDQHVGIASVLLPTSGLPYTMIKFPHVGAELADRTALELAQRRKPQVESAAPALALVASPPGVPETPLPADAAAS